jgi:opacity protein-like surface antigen
MASPTGRFGEEDLDTLSLKIGLKTGYDVGFDVGYVLSQRALVGVAFDYSRFDFDLSPDILEAYSQSGIEVADGHSSALQAQAWLRYFLNKPLARWRPYAVVGVGMGIPKGIVEYAGPTQLSEDLVVVDQESAVGISVLMTAGIGALIPVAPNLALSIEPRYRRISTKGRTRTDTFTREDGSTVEVKYGTDGSGGNYRLKAKSNTEWWEMRAGIVFALQ